MRLLRQSPYYSTQQVYFLIKRGTKASIICYVARIHNLEGESCDFRDEELLWCRMCTPGKSVSREYQRKLKVVIFNCLSWLFTSCTKETWSFGSCTNVVSTQVQRYISPVRCPTLTENTSIGVKRRRYIRGFIPGVLSFVTVVFALEIKTQRY